MNKLAESKDHPTPEYAVQPSTSLNAAWLVFSLFMLAAALRIYKLNVFYWVDELYTRERGGGSFWQALTYTTYPFVDVLAWFTTRICDTEWALRLPSVAAGVVEVGAMYWLGKKAHSRLAGVIAALLVALSPFHIQHSQNARYYAFMALFATLALALLLQVSASVRLWHLLSLTLLTAVGLLTHPFYAFAGAGIPIAFTLWQLGVNKSQRLAGRLKAIAAVGAAVAVGFLPLLLIAAPRLLATIAPGASDEASNEVVAASGKLIHHLTAGKFLGYIHEIAGGGIFAIPILAVAVVGLGILFYKKSPLALAVVLFFAASAPLFFIRVKHFYDSRYFTYLLPVIMLCSGVGVAWIVELFANRGSRAARKMSSRKNLALAAVAIVSLGSLPSLGAYYRTKLPHDNWGFVARHLSDHLTEGDVLFLAATIESVGCNRYRNLVLDYYSNYFMPEDNRRCWIPRSGSEAQCLLNTIEEFPSTTIWIAVTHSRTTPDLSKLITNLCGKPVLPGSPSLYALPGSTKNLVAGGGFEEPLQKGSLPEGCRLAPSQISEGGANCLYMENGVPDKFAVMALNVTPDGKEAVLEQNEIYTLSLNLRLQNIRYGRNTARVFKVGVAGKDANGKAFWNELLLLRGSADWRRYVLRLVPGQDLPSNARSLSVRIGLFGATGSAWVDNVQLERKPNATPFVQGIRPPHTEILASKAPDEPAEKMP